MGFRIIPEAKPPKGYGEPKQKREPENLLPKSFNEAAPASDVGKLTYQGLRAVKGLDGQPEVVANFHEKTGPGKYTNVDLSGPGLKEYLYHRGPISPDIDRFNQGQVNMGARDLADPTKVMNVLVDAVVGKDANAPSAKSGAAPSTKSDRQQLMDDASATGMTSRIREDVAQTARDAADVARRVEVALKGPTPPSPGM